MNIQTQMAEQQLLGFATGKCDGRVVDLVSAMELKKSEWKELNDSGLLQLDASDIDAVDEYFANVKGK